VEKTYFSYKLIQENYLDFLVILEGWGMLVVGTYFLSKLFTQAHSFTPLCNMQEKPGAKAGLSLENLKCCFEFLEEIAGGAGDMVSAGEWAS
jgi:hypothetical protein